MRKQSLKRGAGFAFSIGNINVTHPTAGGKVGLDSAGRKSGTTQENTELYYTGTKLCHLALITAVNNDSVTLGTACNFPRKPGTSDSVGKSGGKGSGQQLRGRINLIKSKHAEKSSAATPTLWKLSFWSDFVKKGRRGDFTQSKFYV